MLDDEGTVDLWIGIGWKLFDVFEKGVQNDKRLCHSVCNRILKFSELRYIN